MKLLIASDIHGSAFYCRKLMETYEKEGADRMVLLGDILYHGPRNDLPAEYAPKEVIRMLNEKRHEIYAVRGNCEAEVDQYWNFRCSLIICCCFMAKRPFMPRTDIFTMKTIFLQ